MRVIYLSTEEMPRHWYNVLSDLPFELDPPLDPETTNPISPEKLLKIFPEPLLEQEMTKKRFIEIPDEVLKEYLRFRPTPLIRAKFLEEYLDTPAKIFYKYEGVSPTGSHKTNTAIAQVYYNRISGTKVLYTETGAGQWGSALSYAGLKFNIPVKVFMVRVSFEQKPMRKQLMNLFGGDVVPSPSKFTEFGKSFDENHPGSLGIAISEAMEKVLNEEGAKYSLGSVLNHVLLHQTVIGLEIKKQLEKVNLEPDVIIACHGGGSNFGGTVFPFVPDKLSGKNVDFVACEPESCPTLTKGVYRYDFGDSSGLTPLLKMYTLGKDFIPPKIHAGGLRYHGASPIISRLVKEEIIRAESFSQDETFNAARIFAKVEGIVPAPESAHAIAGAIREAKRAKEEKREKVIVFTLSGHGLFDLSAYS
ncbi:tryptophan synthase subunit beta [Thermosipho melanesiensis]|uniref:Tryptophan synthase beta chain n=2 Tax=Thermosipho melanesiensis TaxID=46541 RepID=A6LKY8_THEM4|nr:TrpB-like pyridoxal phosphate-dependent enzyme [Thermosipho melanesiensis]ABR30589.1 pyridoxal-phosphate dependent TrpB-like enzyme [Thermosipho melanesiensis BI429]APT73733.1 tryptophan synthase subunit beta [Thermosipho melanesiensis]OOC35670.1 tryptophan synthase subunit beta [Thermosipho melanesiensis]OOC38969.1 tryptophan synthase subunit beta [Thermosipho melanesiensis]OOC39117.1 tryptophan synthase subunit beta [Thermosipho melanesiensis]